MRAALSRLAAANPSWPYVAPFVLYLILLGLGTHLPGGTAFHYPLRVLLVTASLLVWSRRQVSLRAPHWAGSLLVGVAVFVLWVAPDVVWPGYRSHWLFQNVLTGKAVSSIPPSDRVGVVFLSIRLAGSVILVPVVEELFWRAWLLRYLVSRQFQTVPLGSTTWGAFWISAILFASEHGPYWDVGLATGAVLNLWMMKTRNVADCIVAHMAANGCLAAYVMAAGQWQYWL